MTVEEKKEQDFVLLPTETRVYVWHAVATHIVDSKRPLVPHLPTDRQPSLCGFVPAWPGVWWGNFDDEDREKAKARPLCKRCAGLSMAYRVGEENDNDGE